MSKLNLLIDTSSLSHLALISVELNRQIPSVWLWKLFNIFTCNAVIDEFLDGISNRSGNEKAIGRKLSNKKVELRTKYTRTLEENWLHDHYYKISLSRKDKGERHLICSAVELVYYKELSRCIIVVDDQRAVNHFMQSVKSDINFGEIWSTLDLITYMFFAFRDVTVQFARDAIRDISGNISYPIRQYKKDGYSDQEARISISRDYFKKINQIKKFKQQIPGN